MQALIISIIANVILIILVLSLFRNRIIEVYREYKRKKETRAKKENYDLIKEMVNQYLEEIKNA